MTKLDQFQSVFLAADKTVLHYEKLAVERVLVVSDLDGDAAGELLNRVRTFLSVVDGEGTRWARLDGGGFSSVKQLLDAVDEQAPDLVVTYRHLHSSAWQWPHSLGEYLDVLIKIQIIQESKMLITIILENPLIYLCIILGLHFLDGLVLIM